MRSLFRIPFKIFSPQLHKFVKTQVKTYKSKTSEAHCVYALGLGIAGASVGFGAALTTCNPWRLQNNIKTFPVNGFMLGIGYPFTLACMPFYMAYKLRFAYLKKTTSCRDYFD